MSQTYHDRKYTKKLTLPIKQLNVMNVFQKAIIRLTTVILHFVIDIDSIYKCNAAQKVLSKFQNDNSSSFKNTYKIPGFPMAWFDYVYCMNVE